MRRRDLLTAACAPLLQAQAQPKPPNIVVILTDDQRFDTIRALGNSRIYTPNMDRLVRRGVSFTHAFTQGGLHAAICQPSRAQLMSGRSVFRVHQELIAKQATPNPEYVTFPEQLRKAGYVTFATGKWHNGTALFNRSFSSGGGIFFGGMDDHLKTTIHDYDPSGRYPSSAGRTPVTFSSRTFADQALSFLRMHDRSTPYLLYIAFTSPHDPRMAPSRFEALYPPEKIRLPQNFKPQHPFDNGELKVRDELLAAFPRTEEEVRKHIAAYYAMISEVDHQIGRILNAVNRNTYIVFASDNGLAVGQHGLMGKQNLYDHSWRVPMIVTGPGIPRDRRADSLCYLMDLCPAILDIAGVAAPAGIDARSLKPALENPDAVIRESVIGAYRQVQRAVRTDRWKLILYNVAGQRRTQLFDMQADPLELKNLADRPELSPIIAELTALLQRQLKEAGDDTDLNATAWRGSDEL